MSQEEIVRLSLVLISFFISYWAVLSIDFSKIIRKNQTLQAQILAVLLAMALAGLVYQFIMSLQVFK